MSYELFYLNAHLVESELSVMRQGDSFSTLDAAKYGPVFGFLSALDRNFTSQLAIIDIGGQGGRLGRYMKKILNIHLGKYSVVENRQFVNLALKNKEFECEFKTLDDEVLWEGPKILIFSNSLQYLSWEQITSLFKLKNLAAIFLLKTPLLNKTTHPIPFAQKSRLGDHGPAEELRFKSQEIVTNGFFYSINALEELSSLKLNLLYIDPTPEWSVSGSQIYNYSIVFT